MARARWTDVHGDGWYGASQAARVSGLAMAMVNYLCRSRIVEPSCSCTRGHGTPRHYSFGDLVALRLVAHLSQAGVRPLRLRNALQALRKHHPSITLTTLPARHIVTDGVHLYLRQEGEALERIADGQLAFAFVVELGWLQAEVARGLRRVG
jgi:hypothetical protein